MASYNKIEIIGNLGADPKMKNGRGGTPMTSFPVPTNFVTTSLEGERKQFTEWFTVITFNKLAEQCNQFLAKGRSVFVEGRLQSRSWTNDEGEVKHRNEIVASRVIFLDKRDKIDEVENGDEVEAPEF